MRRRGGRGPPRNGARVRYTHDRGSRQCRRKGCRPKSLRNEQRTELQHDTFQDRQTANPVSTLLSLAPPVLSHLCVLGLHESLGLARIHSYAVKANPIRGDEMPSHDSGEGQREENGEPDCVKGQPDRGEYLRQKRLNSAGRITTVRADGTTYCRTGRNQNVAPEFRARAAALLRCINSCNDVPMPRIRAGGELFTRRLHRGAAGLLWVTGPPPQDLSPVAAAGLLPKQIRRVQYPGTAVPVRKKEPAVVPGTAVAVFLDPDAANFGISLPQQPGSPDALT